MRGTRTRRVWAAVADDRGTALIIAVIMLLIMSLFLFGFQMLNRNELAFAGYSRNSTLAFSVAEAGAQEGLERLTLFGGLPGATCFPNSLTATATCGASTSSPNTNTVVYQAALSSNAALFPILSLATVAGAPRAVRVLEQVVFKTGFGDTIVGPQVTFQGDSSPIVGDTYSDTSIVFASFAKSPPAATGATATNLLAPQVLGGTTIQAGSGGQAYGPYTTDDCASDTANSEVAPTACSGKGGRVSVSGKTLPVNWHPMTPVAISSADFTTLMSNCYSGGCAALGVTVVQATQSGTGVTYTPVSYTPSYWSFSGANGKVLLAVATQPVCVNSSANQVTAPPCGSGSAYYGSSGTTTRFLDSGLIQDDATRGSALTFFQAPSCTAPCANAGNQNGVRYVPLIPQINVLGLACNQNVNPGTNAFYDTTGDGKTCANPPTVAGSTTFSGTKSNPEFLVIDNGAPGGTPTQIFGSIASGNTGCSTSFNNYNWGVIMATGDIDLQAGFKFSGYIYTPGNVFSHGNVAVQGGIFSSNAPSSGAQVNEVDDLGTINFCGGEGVQFINSQFATFSTLTWEDRPLGQP
jgi:hypothetical protein